MDINGLFYCILKMYIQADKNKIKAIIDAVIHLDDDKINIQTTAVISKNAILSVSPNGVKINKSKNEQVQNHNSGFREVIYFLNSFIIPSLAYTKNLCCYDNPFPQ